MHESPLLNPDSHKESFSAENGREFFENLTAGSEHVLKALGTRFMVEAGTQIELPAQTTALLVAGGVGCLGAGEVVRMWQSGELRKFTEPSESKGGKSAIGEYFTRRMKELYFWTDMLSNTAIIGASAGIVDPEWAGLSIAIDFTSFRSDYHIFAAKAHGIFAGLNVVATALGGVGEAMNKFSKGIVGGVQEIGFKKE